MVTKKKVVKSTGDIAPKEAAATVAVSRTMRDVLKALASSIAQGTPWHRALLEAVGRWPLADEEVDGVSHRYILMGEAFDWLALAGRLLEEVDGLVTPGERDALLFNNRLPDDVSESEFADYLGPEKHRGHLNYFYGVVVEEALLLAVEEAVRKERGSQGLSDGDELINTAYRRTYGADQDTLLGEFRQQLGREDEPSMSVTELKEFTYWLFKRRVDTADSSRVASDTQKGLMRLARLQGS